MFFAAFAARNTVISLHLNAGTRNESILRKTSKWIAAKIAA